MATLHPFLGLMKTYVIDYTNSHDTSWIPKIMTEDYTVNICGYSLERSETYLQSVEALFSNAPGLGLTVHQMYCNGNRLAMRFSEHAAFSDQGGKRATWRGFSTYTWDEDRLTKCWVEQDFHSRSQQFEKGDPHSPGVPAVDPWATAIVPEDDEALAAGRRWLEKFDLSQVERVDMDDNSEVDGWQLEVQPHSVQINDVFSVGRHVPFHVALAGPTVRDAGKDSTMAVCGVLTVGADGSVERIQAVSDRLTVLHA